MKHFLLMIVLLVFCTSVFAVVPDALTRVVDGQWTLQLTKQNFRGTNFEVLIQNSTGSYDTYAHDEVRTFIGTVDEDPSAIAAGYLRTDGVLLSAIFFDGHGTYIYQGDTQIHEKGWGEQSYSYPTQPTVSAGHAGTTMYEWGIGYDIDFRAYLWPSRYNSDPAYAMERTEFGHVCMALLFMQDALLKPMIERVIIRGSQAYCPYDGTTGGGLLGLLSNEWNNNQSDALPYCMKVFLASPAIGGGVAALYGRHTVNYFPPDTDLSYHIGRHELGHNWGARDMEAGKPEGSTIMNGNQYGRYCGPSVQDFLNHRDNNMSYLTSVGTYTAVAIAPYASLDITEIKLGIISSVTFDVLANDFDANGDTLSIDSFDAVSANGGTVSLDGQNLVYTLSGVLGLDYFEYKIVDSSGMTATGAVLINIIPYDPLQLYMKFDESTGTVANDESISVNNGTLQNGFDFSTNSVAGQFGGALSFDGVDDFIVLDDYMGISGTQSRTIAAWIKTSDTNGVIANWGGNGIGERINFKTQNNNGTVGGIRLEVNSGYIVGNTNICDNKWHHVAAVIIDDGSPNIDEVLLYVDGVYDGVSASLSVPINTVLTNSFRIGTDTAARYFAGSIDDLRVYDFAMSQPEIQNLLAGGLAQAPSPTDTVSGVGLGMLSWVSGALAISNDVYIGTDLSSVTYADTGSPEYQGSTTASEYMYWAIKPDTTYYWRVDTVTGSGTMTGSVWSFTTAADSIKVFFQGGQSNCVGNADKAGLPTELQSPQTDVPFYFGISPTQQTIELINSGLQWIDLQVDSGYDFGPEILFGRTMADALLTPDNQIAIIKYGHGGTGFVTTDTNVWYGGGDATTTGDGNVYQAFQSTVSSGLTSLAAANPEVTIEIAGMTWIQGEQDAIAEPGDYETDLTDFITDIRLTYGTDLPIVIAQLSDSQTAIPTTNLNIVKAAQANIAAADPLIEMVVTDGLTVRDSDHIHYDPPAQITIGTELAYKMLDILGVSYSICTYQPAGDFTGPDGNPDCKVDFYDFAVFAADWMLSTSSGGPLLAPGTIEVAAAEPASDVIVSGGVGGPHFTKIFDPAASTNHGLGNMFFTPDTGSDWTMTSLTIRKNTAQTFSNGTLKLWVYEGTRQQWSAGDGDSDGNLFDGTGITNILVDGQAYTVNGSFPADNYVTLNLPSPVTLANNGNYGFMLKYDQGGDSNTSFQIYQYGYPGGNAEEVGYQTQLLSDDNIDTDSPLTYYVLGFTDCSNPLITDISGPAGQPDCIVNIYDLVTFSEAWLNCGLYPVDVCWQ